MKLKIYCALLFAFVSAVFASAAETIQSPENQVFQFMQNGVCAKWADGSSNNASAYLWIPENCKKVRGLLILCANVPEHRLVGHPAIREVCAKNDLGIVWCVPSFMNFRKDKTTGVDDAHDYKTSTEFLQELLNGLAEKSGYTEVATAPWLPIGESGHLLMVDALVEFHPERCIAGVWLKNNHLPPKNRTVPALVAFGSAQEWSQTQSDIRTNWNNVRKSVDGVFDQRKQNPNWPLSYLIDGGSGHFDCSEKLTKFLAHYIDCVAQARLADDGSLKPISLDSGWLADLAVPGHEKNLPKKFSELAASERALPWFFDRESAETAQSFAEINWNADTQLPGFMDGDGKILPFNFNGISNLEPKYEADGITFTLRGVMLDQLPDSFTNFAGMMLAKTSGEPKLEWLCGPVKPLGGDKFQICLDRSFGSSACYISARQAGTDTIRNSVQPCGVKIQKNNSGLAQKITFEKIPDVKAGTKSIKLAAKSDSGLPVEFFVRAGPAVVHGDELVFTPNPPRAKFPVAVTVAAWQFGCAGDAPVKTEIVEQTFNILAE
jgi:hypothetical protein